MKKLFILLAITLLFSFKKDSKLENNVKLFQEGFYLEFDYLTYVWGKENKNVIRYNYIDIEEINSCKSAVLKVGSIKTTVKLINDTLYYDLNSYTSDEKIEHLDLINYQEFPLKYEQGFKLRDINTKYKLSSNSTEGILLNRSMTYKQFNRIIGEEVDLVTPAGTFSCYTVNYDQIITSGGIDFKYKIKLWFSPELGIIKTETYKKKKLESTTILREFNEK